MKTINNSIGKPNFSQRLNPNDPSTPWNETLETCNVTAAATALASAGWDLAKLNKGLHERPPMDLLLFMRKSSSCNTLYDLLDPKHSAPMNEWVDVLATGIGEYIGETITDAQKVTDPAQVHLIYAAPLAAIHNHIVNGGTCVVRGDFTFTRKDGSKVKSGHFEALVGLVYDDANMAVLQPITADRAKSWIVDDPFGDPTTEYVSQVGNDIVLTMDKVNALLKPTNQSGGKDAIFVPKFSA